MARKLFGTDGVRGVAGELLTRRARARARRAPRPARRPAPSARRCWSSATRASRARCSRPRSPPASPRPAATRCSAASCRRPPRRCCSAATASTSAVVLSASHNPYRDNGIKFFGADGYKLSDDDRAAIERALDDAGAARRHRDRPRPRAARHARGLPARAARRASRTSTCSGLDVAARLRQRRHLPRRARDLPPPRRRRSTAIADEPDGRNINDGCGSTHVEALAERGAPPAATTLGFAFDGDGDRVLAVDRTGAVVDGDELIALAALHLRDAGRLPGDGVAVTVMTNYGFHAAMARGGRRGRDDAASATATCSRSCASAAGRSAASSPGHIIDMGFVRTGDGIASALLTLEALAGGDLAERDAMDKLPQRLVNVRVARPRRARWRAAERRRGRRARGATALEGRGRVLVRPSGTEPLVRVMVEAPTDEEADAVCERLVALVAGRARAERGRPACAAASSLSRVAAPQARSRSLRRTRHVRHRRLRRRAPRPGAPARGPEQARVPRL